ncbi:MAG: class I SAM-dependent methyltransferase [Pseudomonadota bacterium]
MPTANPRLYDPGSDYIGGYTPTDGTMEFYGRVRSRVSADSTVLDLGAGRGAWFEQDACERRVQVRSLKGLAKEVIGADVDEVVLSNRSTDRNIVIDKGIDLPDKSVDVIVADYVLEHVEKPEEFVSEINRILVPGGTFCARTPHKFHYVSIGAMMVRNSQHSKAIGWLQPDRKAVDVFPTQYKLNTLGSIRRAFTNFEDLSYLYRSDPAYFFGSRAFYKFQYFMHGIMPAVPCSNIFAFLTKNSETVA